MLRLVGGQVESLWDEVLPVEARELPEDLAALDVLLCDPGLLAPVAAHWEREARVTGRAASGHGRPTIPIETYVRLMVVKQRTGWGYEMLMREVSDSLHLRRFCLVALGERVPDESTVRKLTRRLGGEVVDELTRLVIEKATRETRFRARAVRIDSTVIEADVRYPTDAGLTLDGARVLAREARKVVGLVGEGAGRVQDRTRALGRRLRAISRTVGRRTGERKQEVLALTEQAGKLLSRTIREARRLAVRARRRARGRGARAKLAQIDRLEQMADRAERVAEQIKLRIAGKPIPDRLVSIFDPDARPIRKGKLGKPNEFGYVAQICEVTQNTKRGARGFILPATSSTGNPQENTLLPTTTSELQQLGLRPREVALDGGFQKGPTADALSDLEPERVFIAGRQQPGSRKTQRRLGRYRTGAEGRISHLKRGYGMRRSRLKGEQGMRAWNAWGILAYNLDTLAIRTA
ncbi:MAG: transposase [Actinobacteria bacterium]|nr:transposase [Actinomycetota bacterium]MCA1698072.1 transposase [Actinomycetota bacterium]